MSNFNFIDKRKILDAVLKDVPKISECNKLGAAEYKAVDAEGNIYLVKSPGQWKKEYKRVSAGLAEDGTPRTEKVLFLIKQKPKVFMTYKEALDSLKVKKDGTASLFEKKDELSDF